MFKTPTETDIIMLAKRNKATDQPLKRQPHPAPVPDFPFRSAHSAVTRPLSLEPTHTGHEAHLTTAGPFPTASSRTRVTPSRAPRTLVPLVMEYLFTEPVPARGVEHRRVPPVYD